MLSLLLASALTSTTTASSSPASTAPSGTCRAIDGDTLRCAPTVRWPKGELVRLLGIDAPDRNCRPGRRCAAGDPAGSKASLSAAIASASLAIRRDGTDRFRRTLANVSVSVNGRWRDLSCHQLASGQAEYRSGWDNGGRTMMTCVLGVENDAPL